MNERGGNFYTVVRHVYVETTAREESQSITYGDEFIIDTL
jgi:hypothetical protein